MKSTADPSCGYVSGRVVCVKMPLPMVWYGMLDKPSTMLLSESVCPLFFSNIPILLFCAQVRLLVLPAYSELKLSAPVVTSATFSDGEHPAISIPAASKRSKPICLIFILKSEKQLVISVKGFKDKGFFGISTYQKSLKSFLIG